MAKYKPPVNNVGRAYGSIRKRIREKDFGFISGLDGQEYFFMTDDAVLQLPKGHTCLLTEQAEVTFRPVPSETYPGKWVAKDVCLKNPPEIEVPQYEESIISDWHKSFGWAKRLCSESCSIFVHGDLILSDITTPVIGDRIRHDADLHVHKGKTAWRAVNIDFYLPDCESNSVAQGERQL
jgi:hypothetical protein